MKASKTGLVTALLSNPEINKATGTCNTTVCPTPQCSEIFNTDCVVYTGEPILNPSGEAIVNTNDTVSEALQNIVTANTSGGGSVLKFIVNKEETVPSTRIVNVGGDGKYYKLGIDFSNFTLSAGNTYTLLIDRWRNQEYKGLNSPVARVSKFYHEQPQDAIANGRLSEVPMTTSTIQYFDFNQDYYFCSLSDITSPNEFPRVKGHTNRGFNYNPSTTRGILRLGIRIRIDNGVDTPIETDYLGFITMIGTIDATGDIFAYTISFRDWA